MNDPWLDLDTPTLVEMCALEPNWLEGWTRADVPWPKPLPDPDACPKAFVAVVNARAATDAFANSIWLKRKP